MFSTISCLATFRMLIVILAISNGIVINLKLDIVNVFFFLDAMQLVNFLADLSHLLLKLEAPAKSIPHLMLAAISHHR